MSQTANKYTTRKLRSSYISTVVSIALVLFMLGLLGTIVLNAKRLSDFVKENIEFSVMLNDNVREADIIRFQKSLDASAYVKSTEYITKESAAQKLQQKLGEDFISFLGFNPLLPSLDVHLKADWANPDSIEKITKDISRQTEMVDEVVYEPILVDAVNKNLRTISMVILVFSGLLFIIALALINNTIRLALYSQRFLIKSMQLVGATENFVRGPFVFKAMLHGFYGALIAIFLLSGVLYMAQREVPELFEIQDVKMFATLFLAIILVGMLISWISTHFAIRRYLRSKMDDLY